MKKNYKFNRNNFKERVISCSCGGKAKLRSSKNYPFGRKSKALVSQFYKCEKCGKKTFVNTSQKGGGRR